MIISLLSGGGRGKALYCCTENRRSSRQKRREPCRDSCGRTLVGAGAARGSSPSTSLEGELASYHTTPATLDRQLHGCSLSLYLSLLCDVWRFVEAMGPGRLYGKQNAGESMAARGGALSLSHCAEISARPHSPLPHSRPRGCSASGHSPSPASTRSLTVSRSLGRMATAAVSTTCGCGITARKSVCLSLVCLSFCC